MEYRQLSVGVVNICLVKKDGGETQFISVHW